MNHTHKHISFCTKAVYICSALVILWTFSDCRKKQAAANTMEQTPQPIAETAYPAKADEITQPIKPDTAIYYSRTPCFGMCPIFSLVVYSNGEAHYEGQNFTNLIGTYRTQWNMASLQTINKKAEQIGYFRMEEVYDNDKIMDLPSVITAIRTEKKLKWVTNRYKAPKELSSLYDLLDETIAKSTWKLYKP